MKLETTITSNQLHQVQTVIRIAYQLANIHQEDYKVMENELFELTHYLLENPSKRIKDLKAISLATKKRAFAQNQTKKIFAAYILIKQGKVKIPKASQAKKALSQFWNQFINDVDFFPKKVESVFITKIYLNNILCIGRQTELQNLYSSLEENPVVIVRGIGGMGKTTLVKQYCKIFQDQYNKIAWLDFNQSIVQSLSQNIDLLKYIGITNTLELEGDKVLKKLEDLSPNNLLIIDGVNAHDELAKNEELLSSLKGWKVIITSRSNPIETNYAFLPIEPLQCKYIEELFYHYFKGKPNTHFLQKIVDAIGSDTLFIEVLAKKAQKLSFTLEEMKDRVEEMLKIGSVRTIYNHKESTNNFRLFVDTFFEVKLLTDRQKQLLTWLSVLPAGQKSIIELEDFLYIPDTHKIEFRYNLSQIGEHGFISIVGRTYQYHPLLKEAMCEKLQPNTKNCEELLVKTHERLYVDKKQNELVTDKLQYIAYTESILEHVKGTSKALGLAYQNLSSIYMYFAQTNRSLELSEKSISIYEKIEVDVFFIAIAKLTLAYNYINSNNIEKALQVATETQLLLSKVNNDENEELPNTKAYLYALLSTIHARRNDFDKGIEYAQKSNALYMQHPKENAMLIVANYTSIYYIYAALQKYQKALAALEKGRDALIYLNEDPLQKLDFLSNYMMIKVKLEQEKEIHKEVQCFKSLLEDTQLFDMLGEYKLLAYYNNLAEYYLKIEENEKAIDYFMKIKENLKVSSEQLNKGDLGILYSNIGKAYRINGQLQESLKYLKTGLTLKKQHIGTKNEDIAISCKELALTYLKLDDKENFTLYTNKANQMQEEKA